MRRRDIQDKIDLYTEWRDNGELGNDEKLTLWLLQKVMKLTEGEVEEPEENIFRSEHINYNNAFDAPINTTPNGINEVAMPTVGRVAHAEARILWNYGNQFTTNTTVPMPTAPNPFPYNRESAIIASQEFDDNVDWYNAHNVSIDEISVSDGGHTIYRVSYDQR